jgi:acyl carrier protein
MTGHLDDVGRARLERTGGTALSSAEGMRLFDTARALRRPALVSIKRDGELSTHPLLRDATGTPAERADRAARVEQPPANRLAGMTAPARLRTLMDLVQEQAADVLGHARPDAVRTMQAFGDQGFDSLTVVELRNRLTAKTGLRLPATLLFRYPTPASLAEYLATRLSDAG